MENLYYISQGATPKEHLTNIENVCKGGVRLVQLRLKSYDYTTYLETAIKAKAICKIHKATLIINDSIRVAEKLGLGVHLGKEDDSIIKAKTVLKGVLIGGTANTLEDCLHLIRQEVDYIGLGPFKFTETKKKLSPIIGLQGYQNIITDLKNQGYKIPVYAIGGITVSDFQSLINIGVQGIAVSSLLSNTTINTVADIVENLKNYKK